MTINLPPISSLEVLGLVEKFGGKLYIDTGFPIETPGERLWIDVEHDEKSNLCGIGLTKNGVDIFYYSQNLDRLCKVLRDFAISGHNIKSDVRAIWQNFGITLSIGDDTCVLSYVLQPNRIHSLKGLCKELLGIEYPSYESMVGLGKKKITLDKQEVERVANYCGMDVLVLPKLWGKLMGRAYRHQKEIYSRIKMPLVRTLFDMEVRGIAVDQQKLQDLERQYEHKLTDLKADIMRDIPTDAGYTDKFLNSPKQKLTFLRSRGLQISSTDRKELQFQTHDPMVQKLLYYQGMNKFMTSFLKPLQEWGASGRIHPKFGIITKTERGISSGRLNCSDPNLQQASNKAEGGKELRKAFIASPGNKICKFDYSQADLRCLAHESGDPFLTNIFQKGLDLHTEVSKRLGVSRDIAKGVNHAISNMATEKALRINFGIPEAKGKRFLDTMNNEVLTVASAWKKQTIQRARQFKGVANLVGLWYNIDDINSRDWAERAHKERYVISLKTQGGTACLIELAMVKLRERGFDKGLLLQVHDELIFEIPEYGLERAVFDIKHTMETAFLLKVPIVVDVSTGDTWGEDK